jgi:hypothetical protein
MTERRLGKKQENIHAYICTPAYDGKVECNYSQSLAEAAFSSPLYNVQITAGVMGNGAFIELARNIFVKRFLEDEEFKTCTHLFFIDADLKFEARAFIGLLKSGHPICAGIYRRRQEPEEYPFKGTENPNGGGLWFIDDWLQCDRVPTGFLCISRAVLAEMAKDAPKINIHGQNGPVAWVFHTKFDEDQRFVGEDYAFCDDYRAKFGQSIPVWTNFNFVHGGYAGNMFDWLTAEKAKQEAPTKQGIEAVVGGLDSVSAA